MPVSFEPIASSLKARNAIAHEVAESLRVAANHLQGAAETADGVLPAVVAQTGGTTKRGYDFAWHVSALPAKALTALQKTEAQGLHGLSPTITAIDEGMRFGAARDFPSAAARFDQAASAVRRAAEFVKNERNLTEGSMARRTHELAYDAGA